VPLVLDGPSVAEPAAIKRFDGRTTMTSRTSTVALIMTLAWGSLAWAGTITGSVKIKGAAQPAVVYVETAPGSFPPPAAHAHVDQQKMTFIPYLLPVVVGTTVDFLNHDSVNHNVFSPDGESYNLGTWPKGETRSYTFKKVGVYAQLCSIHPEMEAFVVVLPNAYYATTDKAGNFKIANVPDGHYVLKVFSKKLKKPEKDKKFPVDVTGGAATSAITF
jgi:plastocyanin